MTKLKSLKRDLQKLWRFAAIYGPRRAAIKAAGRLRIGRWSLMKANAGLPKVGLIGCGQFAFSTIAYFLRGKAEISSCYDIDPNMASSFARMHGVAHVEDSSSALLARGDIDIVYVASNHASHADYAIAALAARRDVYVEKPVAVSIEQLRQLSEMRATCGRRLWAGYNRPFSGAIRDLRRTLDHPRGPISLSCFITGHVIPLEHWYRDPNEGTRICGNVGHWLDLAVHLLNWRSLPDSWRVSLSWSNDVARDDNLAICLASNHGDLINILLSARAEPFEGINETINLQWDDTIAKIDDFRTMTIWRGSKVSRRRYWPKDVGHKRAVLQPYQSQDRAWTEIENSTLLMLHIADMVRNGIPQSSFSYIDARKVLNNVGTGRS